MGLFSWLKGKKPEPQAAPPAESSAAPESSAPDSSAPDSSAPDSSAPDSSAPQAEGGERADDGGESIAELAQALEAKNGALRVDASRILLERWQRGDDKAAGALFEKLGALLDDGEPLARRVGLAAVQLLRKPENLEKHASAVMALLADPVAAVRTAAVRAALKLPGETARVQVRALLSSTDEPLRFDAATALAEIGDAAARPALEAALEEGHRRQEALSALMALGDPAALPALGAIWENAEEEEGLGEFDRTLLAAALARFGDARGADHLAARSAEHGDDRPVAVEWAGRLGVQQAIPALEELADEEGEAARGAALRALGRLKAPGAEERLLRTALDAEISEDLRMDASEGLAELGSERALAALRDLGAQQGELGEVCRELLAELAALSATKAAGA